MAGEGDFIVEFLQVGSQIKVTAFDPVSLREVSIIGSRQATQTQMAQLAIRKLRYVLAKEKGSES